MCERSSKARLLEACSFVASLTTLAVAPGAAPDWVGLGGSLQGEAGGLLGSEEELRNEDGERDCCESGCVCKELHFCSSLTVCDGSINNAREREGEKGREGAWEVGWFCYPPSELIGCLIKTGHCSD